MVHNIKTPCDFRFSAYLIFNIILEFKLPFCFDERYMRNIFWTKTKKRQNVFGASSVQNLVSIGCIVVVSTTPTQLDTLLYTVQKVSTNRYFVVSRAVVVIKNRQSVRLLHNSHWPTRHETRTNTTENLCTAARGGGAHMPLGSRKSYPLP